MKWRENAAMKALAFMIAVASFATTAIMGWYQIMNFDVLWGEYSPGEGYTIRYLQQMDRYDVSSLIDTYRILSSGGTLGTYQAQEQASLEEKLDPANTNLRWQARDSEGRVVYGNAEGSIPARAEGLCWSSYEWTERSYTTEVMSGADWRLVIKDAANLNGQEWESVVYYDNWREELENRRQAVLDESLKPSEAELNAVFSSTDNTTDVLLVFSTSDGEIYAYGPSLKNATTVNEYGYQYTENGWEQVEEDTSAAVTNRLEVVLWLAGGVPVADKYQRAYGTLQRWSDSRELRLAVTIVCAVAGLALMICPCVGAGHKRGVEGIYLNWFHRIPGDLLLMTMFLTGILVLALGYEGPFYWLLRSYEYGYVPMYVQLLAVGCFAAALAALGIAALVTFAARCKARTLFRNTLTWKICRWAWRLCCRLWYGCGAVVVALPLIWKVVAIGMGYIFFTVLTFRGSAGLWLLVTLVVIGYLCLWAWQWKRVRRGTQEIIGGNPDYHIDTQRMLPDLRAHADELNNLGHSISAAVDDRMRSEHFKAELITNVSHDLKTPLTSIINYVDLLKKEQIDNPKAVEYIEVLDRKSQRLKKLTEDLVEASKASTGNLTVMRERLDLNQLLDQAVAEYIERLEGQKLKVVCTLPEEPVWVEADGRHLWRVIDNLLSNCAKYALEGTRVYLTVQQYTDCAVLSIKNISRDALNVPAEQLMERFVRGDESRTAEGSGLGLSIAQSLTDLQHGKFEISIDGDLFKATVTLPLAEEDRALDFLGGAPWSVQP